MNDCLQVKIRLPEKRSVEQRVIIAEVFDGVETVEYWFGRNTAIKQIYAMIPILYMDSRYPPKKKQKFDKVIKGPKNGMV